MKKAKLEIRVFVALAVLALPVMLLADGKITFAKKAVTETVEYVMTKFGYKGLAGPLAKKAEELTAKYGNDVLPVMRKMGPEALDAMEKLGPDAPKYIKLVMKNTDEAMYIVASPKRLRIYINHGDDTIPALAKYRGIMEEAIEKFGAPIAKASLKVDKGGAIQLAKMAKSGELTKIGRTEELLEVVGKYGKKGMDFIWANKGSLMVASTLAAFLNNPQPFIDEVGEIVKPIPEALGEIPKKAALSINWTWVTLTGMAGLITMWFYKQWIRARETSKQLIKNNGFEDNICNNGGANMRNNIGIKGDSWKCINQGGWR